MAEIENVSGEKGLCGGKIIERLTEEEVAVYEIYFQLSNPFPTEIGLTKPSKLVVPWPALNLKSALSV